MPFQTNATIGAYGGGGRAEVRRRKGVLTPRSNTFRGLWVHKCTTKMVRGGGMLILYLQAAAAAPAASASSFFTVQTSYMVIAKVIVPIVSCFLCVVTLIFQQLDSFRFSAKKTAKSISRNRINNHCSLHSAANVQPHTDREACNYYVTCDALS